MINRFPLFNFGWFQPDFSTRLDELASLAMPEKWDYNNTPVGNGHPILFNYIHHTFNKVEAENKVIIEGEKCLFNTGLVTDNQEGIFAYFDKNKRLGATIPWFLLVGAKKAIEIY